MYSTCLFVGLWATHIVSMQQEAQDLGEVLRAYDTTYKKERTFKGGLAFDRNGYLTIGAYIEQSDTEALENTRAQCMQTLMQAKGQTQIKNTYFSGKVFRCVFSKPTLCRGWNGRLGTIFDNHNIPDTHYITTIDVSNNALQDIPLARITRQCQNLESLNASNNRIRYVSFYDEQSQEPHKALKIVWLDHNALKDFNIDVCLSKYPNLSHLDISNNPLTACEWNTHNGNTIVSENLFVNCSNTQLSAIDKEKLVNSYEKWLQKPIHDKIQQHSKVLAAATGVFMLWGYMSGVDVYQAPLASLPFFWACANYWWHGPELNRFADKAKATLHFGEENNVDL